MNYEDAMTVREYARFNEVSESYIRKLRASGKIPAEAFTTDPRNNRPLVSPSVADAAWGIDFRAKKGIKGPEKPVKRTKSVNIVPVPQVKELPKPEDEEANTDDEGMPIVTSNMTMANALKAVQILNAMTAKVKLRKMNGELVEKEAVFKALFLYGQEIRAEFQNIPERIIDDIMASTSRNKAFQMLSSAIDKALEKLSTPPKIK